MDLVEVDDVRGHFSRVIEEIKSRSNEREASFLEIIQSLEADNARLEDDIDSLEAHITEQDSSVERLIFERQQMELDMAALREENMRLRHAAPERHLPNAVEAALHKLEACSLEARGELVALEANTWSNLVANLREALSSQHTSALLLEQHIAALRERRQALIDEEAWHRGRAAQAEADAMEALTQLRGWWLASVRDVDEERRRLRDSTKFAVQLAISVCASRCIGFKGNMVDEEHRAWAELLALEERLRTGDAITLDAPTNDDNIFWQCCLEEAQGAIHAIPAINEDESVMRDVCLRFDLPMVVAALRKQRPQSAFEEWMERVVKPLQLAIAGGMTLYQLSSAIDDLLKSSTLS